MSNETELRARLEAEFKKLDFKELGRDVKAFLFNPADVKRVELFPEYTRQVGLG